MCCSDCAYTSSHSRREVKESWHRGGKCNIQHDENEWHGIIATARQVWNAARRLGNRWRQILCQRVLGSVRAFRAVRNTRVFLTETWFVTDVIPSFSAANSSRIFLRPSVPFPMYRMRGTVWILHRSQDSFYSTSTTLLSTVLAAVMMMSRYCSAISAVAVGFVNAVTPPLAFRLVFMILMWAGAFWWKCTPSIADVISGSILLESGTLSSFLNIRSHSAMLDPACGAGLRGAVWLLTRGGTVSHLLEGVGAGFGFGTGSGLGCSLRCSSGFGCCCNYWHFSGPSSRIASAWWEASSPPPSVPAVISSSLSLPSWPCATPFMIFPIMFVWPAPHCLSSSWRTPHFCSLSCIHVIIPSHRASWWAAWDSTRFARCPNVWCSCVISCACCLIIFSMWLLQSLGAARASLLLLHFLFLFLSIISNMVVPTVPAAMDVAAVAISIATSIGESLLLLQLFRVQVTPPAHFQFGHHCCEAYLGVLVVPSLWANALRQSHYLPSLYVNPLSCVDSCAHPAHAVSQGLGHSLWGQFDIHNLFPPSICQLLSLLSTHNTVSVSLRLFSKFFGLCPLEGLCGEKTCFSASPLPTFNLTRGSRLRAYRDMGIM